jgi:hypothetical protein
VGAGTEAASRAGAAAAICVGGAVVGTLAWVAGAGLFALKRAATRGKNAAAANATAQRKTGEFQREGHGSPARTIASNIECISPVD